MSPFAKPAQPSEGLDLQQLRGSLLLIKVLFLEDHIPTVHTKPGEKSPAIRADVSVLDGPMGGQTFEDTLIFPKVLQSQLRSRIGQLVLGRLATGQAKPGQTAPWKLDPASPADEQAGEAFLRNQTPAMSQPASSQPPF